METPDLIRFIKETKGSGPWDVSSAIRVAVALYVKVQLFSNLSKEQKTFLVCNLVKKVLEQEKGDLDAAIFEKILIAVDEFLPSVLEHIPVPELPKAFTRWFSFIPCSMISVGIHASEELVSMANLKKVEAVLDKVVAVVPAAAPLVSQVEKVAENVVEKIAEVEAVVVEVTQTVNQTVDETKKEPEAPEDDKA